MRNSLIAATLAAATLAAATFVPSAVQADPPGAPDYTIKRQIAKAAPQRKPALSSPAICSSFKSHRRFLAARYGEHPVFSGEAAPGIQMRLFANTTTGSWTMLLVRTNGYSCVRGAGKNFRHDVGT